MKKLVIIIFVFLSINSESQVAFERNWGSEAISYNEMQLTGYLGERLDSMTSQELLGADIEGYLTIYENGGGGSLWECLGEYLGKYLFSMSNMYQYYGSTNSAWQNRLKERMDSIVSTIVDYNHTYGHVMTWTSSGTPDSYSETWQPWGEAYTMLGFLKYYELFGDTAALNCCISIGDRYISDFLNEANFDLRDVAQDRWDGTGRLLQAMIWLYRYTNDDSYLDFAQYMNDLFIHEMFVDTLVYGSGHVQNVRGGDTGLEGGHPHASCLPGILTGIFDYYMMKDTTNSDWLSAGEQFIDDVVENQLYIVGSAGMHEDYMPVPVHYPNETPLSGNYEDDPMEGCANAYWPYINLYLYRITGEVNYIDNWDLGVYNALIACNSPREYPVQCYYLPLNGYSYYNDQNQSTSQPPCCRTAFSRTMGMLPEFIWCKYTDEGIGFLSYEPGYYTDTIHTATTDVEVSVTVDSEFPKYGDSIIVHIDPVSSRQFIVKLRVPDYVTSYSAKVDGQTYYGLNSTMIEIDRTWTNGDSILINMNLGLYWFDGDTLEFPGMVAVKRGVQILSASDRITQDEIAWNFNTSDTITEVSESLLEEDWVGNQIYGSSAIGSDYIAPFADAPQSNIIVNYTTFNTYSGTIPQSSQLLSIPANQTIPNAFFYTDITEPRTGDLVRFYADYSETNADSFLYYAWDFGDGNVDTGIYVTHTYVDTGSIYASLTVMDSDSMSNTDSLWVHVHPYESSYRPFAMFTIDSEYGTVPHSINIDDSKVFDNESEAESTEDGIDSLYYTFGDGDTSTLSSPSHEYSSVGTYKVAVEAYDQWNLGATYYDYVNVVYSGEIPPTASIENGIEHLITRVNDTITLTSTSTDSDGSIVTHAWDFMDTEKDTGVSVSHIYRSPGWYRITLTVTDDDGYKDIVRREVQVFIDPDEFEYAVNDTVYIDPDAGDGGDGSLGSPYNEWSDVTPSDSTQYLIRCKSLFDNGGIFLEDLTQVHFNVYGSCDTTRWRVNDEIYFTNCQHISVHNMTMYRDITDGRGLRFISCDFIKATNCEIKGTINHALLLNDQNRNIYFDSLYLHDNALDGFWVDGVINYEVANCTFIDQNLAFFDPDSEPPWDDNNASGQGDAIQHTRSQAENIYYHGNYSDRSLTGNKFNIIASGELMGITFDGDYFRSPGQIYNNGAAIHIGALFMEMKNCHFDSSTIGYYNVMGDESTNIIHHCLFTNNFIDALAGTYIYNSIFYNASTHSINGDAELRNNIWYLENSSQTVLNSGSYTLSNNIQNILGADGSHSGITVDDPLFINVSNRDFHIDTLSPAIDVGIDLGFSLDYVGNEIDQNPDIGLYEFLGSSVPEINRPKIKRNSVIDGIRRKSSINGIKRISIF